MIENGMPATGLGDLDWVISRHSSATPHHQEAATLPRQVAMRNSRFPQGPVLLFTREEVAAFVLGAKDGDFDDLFTHHAATH